MPLTLKNFNKPGWQPGANLIAYYPFDNDINDHKGDLGYTGTMYNCTRRNSFSYNYATGKVGNCINRTTSGNASLDTGITLSNKFTVMFWVNLVTVSGWLVFMTNKASDDGYGFVVQFANKKPGFKVYNSDYQPGSSVEGGDWHHYAITQDGTSLTFYIDGVGSSYTVNGTAGPRTLQIVGGFDSGVSCKMDEIYVFDGRVLTSEDINNYLSSIS